MSEYAQLLEQWSTHVEEDIPQAYNSTHTTLVALKDALDATEVTSEFLREISAQILGSPETHEQLVDKIENLIKMAGGTEQRKILEDVKIMIDCLKTTFAKYNSHNKILQNFIDKKSLFDRLYAHSITARKHAVKDVIEIIAGTANDFYEFIHPDENISKSKLKVVEHGQGSVEISVDFHGSRENPMLHYSESHLDTLGLSYFLALRWHEAQNNPNLKILIVDDVLTSVDGEHRERIAKLLNQNFSDHQIIISTHDFHFYQYIRRIFGNNGFSYTRINRWDVEKGPRLGDPTTDIDILDTDKRADMNHQDLAARCGRYFEWYLKQITESLEVPVVARFNRGHDIGSLWQPLYSRLKTKNAGFKQAFPLLPDEVEQNGWVRNECGAHDNEQDAPVDPNEVIRFAEKLEQLYDATYCSSCKCFIKKINDGDWVCSCGHIEYKKKVAQVVNN